MSFAKKQMKDTKHVFCWGADERRKSTLKLNRYGQDKQIEVDEKVGLQLYQDTMLTCFSKSRWGTSTEDKIQTQYQEKAYGLPAVSGGKHNNKKKQNTVLQWEKNK